MDVTKFRAASLTVTLLHPETPTIPCANERQALHIQSGAQKVSQLHLYLPSSFCEDEEQDAVAEELRYGVVSAGVWGAE